MPIATTHHLGLLLANKKVNIVNVSVHTMNAHGESGDAAVGGGE
jgi:hypothetical protein